MEYDDCPLSGFCYGGDLNVYLVDYTEWLGRLALDPVLMQNLPILHDISEYHIHNITLRNHDSSLPTVMNIGISISNSLLKDSRRALYTITFSRSAVSTILTNASATPYEKAYPPPPNP